MSKEEINAFLGASTEYSGKLLFQGAVRIDGIFHGEVESEGTLIVGKDATVDASVQVNDLVLSGLLTGTVHAKRKIIIHKGGKLSGDIYTPTLIVEEGARIKGNINMEDDPQLAKEKENIEQIEE